MYVPKENNQTTLLTNNKLGNYNKIHIGHFLQRCQFQYLQLISLTFLTI
jgi:hypothetical protein